MIRIQIVLCSLFACASGALAQPDDFPRFTVPGHEAAMKTLRDLYWLHYPGAGPKATLWDEWLTGPSLWPGVVSNNSADDFRAAWARTMAERWMDDEGYVATHQHASIAHQWGWPFPFWKQGGPDTWGWHSSLEGVPDGWHGTETRDQAGWEGANVIDGGIDGSAWNIRLAEFDASITTPPLRIDVLQSPFLQVRWRAKGLGPARPFIEWTTEQSPEFSENRRVYFDAVESDSIEYTMIPMYRSPEWKGIITRLRIQFANESDAAEVGIQALFTQYDTRHNINNANFVRGCANYFFWTRDVDFLREQIVRMRRAIRYVMDEFHTLDEGVVLTDWVGHDGRSGIVRAPDGTKTLRYGYGIGNNYWDLLPFGHKDAYATIQYYDALQSMVAIEDAIAELAPEVVGGIGELTRENLAEHAANVKRTGNELFWNAATGRFNAGIDADGASHDYGFTFLNLEAIYYDFATPEHADAIMQWIAGERVVEGDTSTGADIYLWRFGPRATTKRNLEYYGWFWSGPESIPWGGQVQDGGAVFGFTFHDLMARLRTRGADNAWARLQEIIAWFDEVQAAGGYRAYYDGTRDGTLQGGGTAGGLGCDQEFFESVLVPQIMIEGFLGFEPTVNGFRIQPNLPSDWPELTVTRIRIHDAILSVRAAREEIQITVEDPAQSSGRDKAIVDLPPGDWTRDGQRVERPIKLDISTQKTAKFERLSDLR